MLDLLEGQGLGRKLEFRGIASGRGAYCDLFNDGLVALNGGALPGEHRVLALDLISAMAGTGPVDVRRAPEARSDSRRRFGSRNR